MIRAVVQSNLGCYMFNSFVNLLAYADYCLFACPIVASITKFINILNKAADIADLSFNTKKTVCMVFNPINPRKTVCDSFPNFSVVILSNTDIAFVPSFKYLGHIIDNCMSDDADISRELKCLFSRANVLIRRFKLCSWTVKIRLFKAFCICFL